MQRLAPHRDAASQALVTPQLELGPRGDAGRGSARAALGMAGSVSRPAGSRQPVGRERFGTAAPSPPCRAKAKTRPLGCLGTGTRGGSGGRRDPQTEVRRPPSRPPAPDARGLRARSRARTGRPARRAALAPPPGLTARATVRTAPPRTARRRGAGRAVCMCSRGAVSAPGRWWRRRRRLRRG